MMQRIQRIASAVVLSVIVGSSFSAPPLSCSWRYYRPGNTGIQGDDNESIWLAPDGNPWISGFDPQAEEGGIAKFLVSQNRWINISNVDYRILGDANDVGYERVKDMVPDNSGNLWLGTWRGAVKMTLAKGAQSMIRYGADNSGLPGGVTADMAVSPDGKIWLSSYGSAWGGGGLARYTQNSRGWVNDPNHGGDKITIQPKTSGGYYVWASGPGYTNDPMQRWDSVTNTWTTFPATNGNPAHLVCKKSTDNGGNVWMTRWFGTQGQEALDVWRPNQTWAGISLPPGVTGVAALRPTSNMQAYMVGFPTGHLYRFNGSSWLDLGVIEHSGFIDDMEVDASGNVWLCGTGTGGAARRDATTGVWQRYRISNTSQYDLFNEDLSISPVTGEVYATGNANPNVGGMMKFDGTRWTTYVSDLGYGLSGPWPFQSPQSQAIHVMGNGTVAVNPLFSYSHLFNGSTYTPLNGGPDDIRRYTDDSSGRLWSVGHYGDLGRFDNGNYTSFGLQGWGQMVRRDPDRAGTIWATGDQEITRTDGTYRFSKTIEDFLGFNASGFISGLAVGRNGIAWTSIYDPSTVDNSKVIKVNANTGQVTVWSHNTANWPFPGDYMHPVAVTPDGKIWMTYDNDYPNADLGLCWWDGNQFGVFPAPPGGIWTFGGLPQGIIKDVEVKPLSDGYELWLSCVSRGIAVLKVKTSQTVAN